MLLKSQIREFTSQRPMQVITLSSYISQERKLRLKREENLFEATRKVRDLMDDVKAPDQDRLGFYVKRI